MATVSLYSWEFPDVSTLFNRYTPETTEKFITVRGPVELTITQHDGDVKVKGWDKLAVNITMERTGSKEAIENTLVAIDENTFRVSITAKDATKKVATVNIKVQTPFSSIVDVTSAKGDIITKGLTRSQTLTTNSGAISISIDKFSVESSIFAHTASGDITLNAPKKIQAQLAATTQSGTITSDILVTLSPQTTLLNKAYWKRIKQEAHGLLGDGGAPITLETEWGNIKLLQK